MTLVGSHENRQGVCGGALIVDDGGMWRGGRSCAVSGDLVCHGGAKRAEGSSAVVFAELAEALTVEEKGVQRSHCDVFRSRCETHLVEAIR